MMHSADFIVMSKIVDIVASPSGGVIDVIKAIIPKIPCIALLVVLKKCIDNTGDVYTVIASNIWKIAKYILYEDLVLLECNSVDNLDYYCKKSIEKKKCLLNNAYFPIYWDVNDSVAQLSITKRSSDHTHFWDECHEDAIVAQSVYELVKTQKKVVYKTMLCKNTELSYSKSNASKLYPSRNYKKLVDSIKTHFSVSDIVESFSVIGMLIDGIPGLGKTKFAEFAVEERLAGHVYKVDMTCMLKFSFSRVLESMYRDVEIVSNTIFMIDEIDKYIDYRISLEYNELKDSIINSNNTTSTSSTSDVTQSKVIKPFSEFQAHAKTTFLYDMLSILERDGLKHSVVVIFCSNNFHSIFEGVDLTHHKSLYDRFMKIKFEECDHTEIIEYILYYNNRFINTEYHLELDVDNLKNSLRRDVRVTHRTLHHISIHAKYNAFEMIKLLNIHKNEDDSGESLIDKIGKMKNLNDVSEKDIVDYELSKNSISQIPSVKNITKVEDEESSSEINEDDYIDYTDENSKYDFEQQLDEIVKDLPEHKQIWTKKFLNGVGPKKVVSIEDMMIILNKIDNPENNYKNVVIEMFDTLADGGYIHAMKHSKFFDVIVGKCNQFYDKDPHVFVNMKPETKEFVYACSGIDVR